TEDSSGAISNMFALWRVAAGRSKFAASFHAFAPSSPASRSRSAGSQSRAVTISASPLWLRRFHPLSFRLGAGQRHSLCCVPRWWNKQVLERGRPDGRFIHLHVADTPDARFDEIDV